MTSSAEKVIQAFLDAPLAHVKRVLIPRSDRTRRPREAWKILSPDITSFLASLRLHFDSFLRHTQPSGYPHPSVHGYVQGRSALTNARVHVGRKRLLQADVQDFFPSIKRDAVQKALLGLGCKSAGANLVASIVTLNDALPLGYPTSPLFSNIILLDIDRQLQELAVAHGAAYSRYADDLTFSSDERLPTLATVADVLRRASLELRPAKSHVRRTGQKFHVTGYTVNDAVARAPRAMKRRLRQQVYFAQRHGLTDHVERIGNTSVTAEYDRITGQIEHVRHAEPKVGAQLTAVWSARRTDLDGELVRPTVATATAVSVLFDDSDFTFCGVKYRALGAVVLRDSDAAREQITALADDVLLHPLVNERGRRKVRESGLHYTDLTPDFRRDAVELAARLSARAHVVFDVAADTKAKQLAKFIRSALKWRLQDCSGKLVSVVFEQGVYIKAPEAEPLVREIYDSLPAATRPLRIESVRVVAKLEDPCVAVADIFLGVWQQFARSRDPEVVAQRERNELLFRAVGQRFGTIYESTTGKLYNRRVPFDGLPAPALPTP